MSQRNENFGGKHYVLFILFLIVYGAITPVIYVLVFSYLESYYWTMDKVSPESFVQGNWYTLCATLLLLHAAYLFRPTAAPQLEPPKYESVYFRYRSLLFYSAVIALCIDIVFDLIYGRMVFNLTPQRPPIVVYLSYLSRGFSYSGTVIVLFSLLLYKKLDRFAFIIVLLTLTRSMTAWSRSGLFDVCFLIFLGLAYSSAAASRTPLKKIIVIVVTGVIVLILGDMNRGAPAFLVFFKMLSRLYENNQVLYLAIENPAKVYEILTDGQPRVLLQQLFSFVIERTEYPSSSRLVEYWGGTVAPDERGHIAGYAYGWLGLTFGLFGWYGLIAVYLFFLSVFALLRATARRTTLVNLVCFTYFAGLLYESFGNLGLDSFVEKIFKGFLYAIVYILAIRILALLTTLSPSRNGALEILVKRSGTLEIQPGRSE